MEKLSREDLNDRRTTFEILGRELWWIRDKLESRQIIDYYKENGDEEFAETIGKFFKKTVDELQDIIVEGSSLKDFGINDSEKLLDFLEVLADLCYAEAERLHNSSLKRYD